MAKCNTLMSLAGRARTQFNTRWCRIQVTPISERLWWAKQSSLHPSNPRRPTAHVRV